MEQLELDFGDVPLSGPYVRQLFDYRDGKLFWRYRPTMPKQWNVRYCGKEAGNRSDERGYVRVRLNGRQQYAHRLVWLWHGGGPAEDIDHINRDTADNRIENLRGATRSQNLANAPRAGVSFFVKPGRWGAQLTCRGVHHWLGYWGTREEAESMWRRAFKQFFGEYAWTK